MTTPKPQAEQVSSEHGCPFCALRTDSSQDDLLVVRSPLVLAFPAPRQRPDNRGHVLIVPAAHVTRLADAGPELLTAMYGLAGRISIAVREAFGATGTLLFQNENVPDQVIHHLHLHVVPRWTGDGFRLADPVKDELSRAERIEQAQAIAKYLG